MSQVPPSSATPTIRCSTTRPAAEAPDTRRPDRARPFGRGLPETRPMVHHRASTPTRSRRRRRRPPRAPSRRRLPVLPRSRGPRSGERRWIGRRPWGRSRNRRRHLGARGGLRLGGRDGDGGPGGQPCDDGAHLITRQVAGQPTNRLQPCLPIARRRHRARDDARRACAEPHPDLGAVHRHDQQIGRVRRRRVTRRDHRCSQLPGDGLPHLDGVDSGARAPSPRPPAEGRQLPRRRTTEPPSRRGRSH